MKSQYRPTVPFTSCGWLDLEETCHFTVGQPLEVAQHHDVAVSRRQFSYGVSQTPRNFPMIQLLAGCWATGQELPG